MPGQGWIHSFPHFFLPWIYYFFKHSHIDCLFMFQASASVGGGFCPPSHLGPGVPSIPGCHGHQHRSPEFPQQGRGEWRSWVEVSVVQTFRWSRPLLPVLCWLELLCSPSAKGLETALSLWASEENQTGLVNWTHWLSLPGSLLLVTKYLPVLFLPYTEYTHPIPRGDSSMESLHPAQSPGYPGNVWSSPLALGVASPG